MIDKKGKLVLEQSKYFLEMSYLLKIVNNLICCTFYRRFINI